MHIPFLDKNTLQCRLKETAKTLVKQLLNIRLVLEVEEYRADVYYNAKAGERVHAAFSPGVVDEVNYGGSIKAFLFLLNNDCCTSIDKSLRFLSDLTDGKRKLSKGMASKLGREFAKKTEQERKKIFSQLLLSPVMHTDCTNAVVNGKSAYVFICASPDGKALYFAHRKKGHKGVEGTPVQDYDGIIVQDHESTFYKYGLTTRNVWPMSCGGSKTVSKMSRTEPGIRKCMP